MAKARSSKLWAEANKAGYVPISAFFAIYNGRQLCLRMQNKNTAEWTELTLPVDGLRALMAADVTEFNHFWEEPRTGYWPGPEYEMTNGQ